MVLRSKILSAAAFVACSVACSSSPANFAGTYTVTIVNGPNACGFANYTAGDSQSNIPVTMSQDAANAEITVGGGVGLYLDLLFGTASFNGTVNGNEFTANFIGGKTATQGACMYTVDVKIDITLDTSANTITGTLGYTPATNQDPSCGTLNMCSQQQSVVGARTN